MGSKCHSFFGEVELLKKFLSKQSELLNMNEHKQCRDLFLEVMFHLPSGSSSETNFFMHLRLEQLLCYGTNGLAITCCSNCCKIFIFPP